jgi:putative ABC transport system substrate-binding protein
VAVVANSAHPGVTVEREAALAAARRLGLTVTWYPMKAAGELDGVLAAIAQPGTDALLAIPDNLINRLARPIAEFATARRLPTMSGWSEFVEAGNLMSYGPNYAGFFRQLGTLADRLLRGASPADTAVELPREIELVISTRTARSIGLELPPGLLLRADRRIA